MLQATSKLFDFLEIVILKQIDLICYRERTVLMSILSGIGIAILPLAEFLSGQLYQVISAQNCTRLTFKIL